MIMILRILRGFVVFFLILQIIGILPVIFIGATSPDVMAFLFIKVIFALLCAGIYFGFYKLINNLHQKQTGTDKLVLKSHWSL